MAHDYGESGIRSVTYTVDKDGNQIEMDPVDWTIKDYFVNNQDTEQTPLVEPLGKMPVRRKSKTPPKPKPISKEKLKPVGDEMVAKAQKKDLRRRGLA